MFKSFSAGIVLGLLLAAAGTWLIPVHNLHREPSRVTVMPNGGNAEVFRIELPNDRIASGGGPLAQPVPEGIEWPRTELLSNTGLELFKIRNVDNEVIGLASRLAATDAAGNEILEWVLHLPARGTMYALMEPGTADAGGRSGSLRSGTREFSARTGLVLETFSAAAADVDGGTAGRIELRTQLVGTATEQVEGGAP